MSRRHAGGLAARLAVGLALTAGIVGACGEGTGAIGTLELSEFAIVGPHTAEAGAVRLDVVNEGNAHHNLTVCPGDVGDCTADPIRQTLVRKPDDARDPSAVPDDTTALVIGSGWEATVEVDLEPGRYRLWCAIIGHADLGMDTVLTVE